jgi:hypothetical protein
VTRCNEVASASVFQGRFTAAQFPCPKIFN